VEKLADAKGESVYSESLSFDADNHDDILVIVNRLQEMLPFDGNTAASIGFGLK